MSKNLRCKNSYESVLTIKFARTSINYQFAGISTFYYELMK
ncbi:hypothetical protein LEP1GSC137_0267 [Leptospira borgpetersenii str. Noumea 25]|nr:hypothetical protein LEP1GSC137_0267 [Leptospira borgpetersenii str. Noumea 25]